jgi:hypothetical protein
MYTLSTCMTGILPTRSFAERVGETTLQAIEDWRGEAPREQLKRPRWLQEGRAD